jgi:hypothetical protein
MKSLASSCDKNRFGRYRALMQLHQALGVRWQA